jgi:hypothetical protein
LFTQLPAEAFVWSQKGLHSGQAIYRIVLSVEGSEYAASPWETILEQVFMLVGTSPAVPRPAPWLIVRSSPVRPRLLNTSFKLPLRILQLNPRPEHPLPVWVRSVFGSHPDQAIDKAVQTAALPGWALPDGWPLVDVLHIDTFPEENPTQPILTNASDRPGTLGWFVRWTNLWQTRLVVFNCVSKQEADTARELAHRLCDKGGPAVLVAGPEERSPGALVSFYQSFYSFLIHDFPLDSAVDQAAPGLCVPTLFVGSGREEGVRVSSAGQSIAEFATPPAPGGPFLAEKTRSVPLTAGSGGTQFSAFKLKWDNWNFSLHEGDGLIPMAYEVDEVRRSIPPPSPQAISFDISPIPPAPAPPPEARFVNAAFWSGEGDALARLDPDVTLLQSGVPYQLGIQIGPKDLSIETIDAKAILEEVFKWSPEKPGVWVEIGVAGIDFDVAGDPVQELWLPRQGASEAAYFTVTARKGGAVAKLRYGLYYQNNLIQSFRLAAFVSESASGGLPGDVALRLASALAVSPDKIGDALYKSRLEYSRTSALDQIERKSERALTIVANQLDGQDILTIKGAEVFNTRVYPDDELPNIVTQIRAALNQVAYDPGDGSGPPLYRFGIYAPDLEQRLKDALVKLAAAGVRLYLNLAATPKTRKALDAALAGERKVIHVAQLLRKKVIPWAFVYDCEFDENIKVLNGKPVEQGVCLAALPQSGADLRTTTCGTHPECLLHPDKQVEQQKTGRPPYCEKTVACPLHFWGFRHIIEVPPQQVEDEDSAHEEVTCIVPKGGIQFTAGLNASLATASTHWTNLAQIGSWEDPVYARDLILDRLRREDLDFIYFFCHARGGQMDPGKTDPPYLEFQPPGGVAQWIRPQDFADAVTWSHGPLIFLNACGTLGYSPDALSPFLKALVDGRGAAGVLGTEIPVAEFLAGEAACAFVTRFVKGESAGNALLDVRRQLLGRKNPLGLIYTLYAPASLAVDADGDGKCP